MPSEYREKVTSSLTFTDNSYTEEEILFPNIRGPFRQSARYNVPMVCIHGWNVQTIFTTAMDASLENSECHFAESSESAVLEIDDLGCVEVFGKQRLDCGTAGSAVYNDEIERLQLMNPKILYPYDSIWFGVQSHGAGRKNAKVDYTVRMVNKNEVLRSVVPRR